MKDKKRMFDYFEIDNAKEISEKDLKKLRKIYETKRTILGVRKSGRTYNIDEEMRNIWNIKIKI